VAAQHADAAGSSMGGMAPLARREATVRKQLRIRATGNIFREIPEMFTTK
jgi:hypothetical protein